MESSGSFILEQNLISNFRTGNVILDTLISMIISGAYGRIRVMHIKKYITYCVLLFKRIFGYKNDKTSIDFIIRVNHVSAEYTGARNDIPLEYKAIIHKLDFNKIDYKKITLLHKKKSYWSDSDETVSGCEKLNYMLNVKDIKITDDISISQHFNIDTIVGGNDNQIKYDQYNVSLYSKTLTITQLKTELKQWIEDYKRHIMEQDIKDLRYIIVEGKEQIVEDSDKILNIVEYKDYKLETYKNFDNIFFEGKDKLLKRIDTFQNRGDQYKRLGVPHNLGLLFYGEPGCGKTSCIKAMANKLQRHVIEVNLSKMKTSQQLRTAFYEEIINDMYIPISKRIIVLEDIDCMDDIVKQRDTEEKKKERQNELKHKRKEKALIKKRKKKEKEKEKKHIKNKTDTESSDSKSDSESDSDSDSESDSDSDSESDSESETDEDDLKTLLLKTFAGNFVSTDSDKPQHSDINLSFILNIIDGILEQNLRFTVMSTNDPKKLDSALIRTGRIDMKLHFEKCNHAICKQIVEYYYNDTYECIYPNGKYSPSDIIEICFSHDNIADAAKAITTGFDEISIVS